MNWITPITDRTAADITNRTARGFLNASDINRIEGNIAWLAHQLSRFNIFANITSVTDWNTAKVPNVSDFQRIRSNIITLAAYAHAIRPDLWVNFHYIHEWRFQQIDFVTVNLLEMNVYLLRQVIDRMSIIYRQASFKSGQQLFLPQRRV
ncbi:MAG: hypothetical protein FWC77_04165 [Defluviitaleaceae bacterium]|nr:hypothetical protein [Defluviitaleaceae bacterium]